VRRREHPVCDAELVAFAEGRLGRRAGRRVAAHLRAHPADADRVRAYIEQDARLRRLYDPVLQEPVPARLRHLLAPPEADGAARRGLATLGLAGAALAVAALLVLLGPGGAERVGGLLGPVAEGGETPEVPPTPSPLAGTAGAEARAGRASGFAEAVLAARAAERDAVSGGAAAGPRGPVGSGGYVGHATEAAPSGAAPDLSGLGLVRVSVRELERGGHTFTEWSYRDARGARVALYESAPEARVPEMPERGDAVLRVVERAGTPLVEWRAGGRRYALVGELRLAGLTRLALQTREALPRPALAAGPEPGSGPAARESLPEVVRPGPRLDPGGPPTLPPGPSGAEPVVARPRTHEM